MKLNLLATTAVAALFASAGVYAHAQGPVHKQDEKARMHQRTGPAAKQEPLAAKQNRGAEKQLQTKDTAAEQGKATAQHALDAQHEDHAAHDQMNAKKDEALKAAEHAQQKKPDKAAEKKDQSRAAQSRDHGKGEEQAAMDNSQREKTSNRTAEKNNDKRSTKGVDQAKDYGQNSGRSKQSADKSKPDEKSNKNAVVESKSDKRGSRNDGPGDKGTTSAADKGGLSSKPVSAQTGIDKKSSTQISEQDRTKIFSTLKSEKRASHQQININVSVGERLPRHVHARPLPRTVVEVLPQYRGYDYVTVRDEIAIVRPGTRKVVDVIREPGSSSSFASMSTHASSTTIHLTDQQRTKLRQEARRFTSSQVSSSGSQCLSLQPVPSFLANENPDMQKYRMLAIGDDIVLVDPNQKKVVDVIH
jgi:hypothetical protein